MDSTGLEDILGATFNGISNMLNGKAWPKVTGGFRMVVIALLQPFVVSGKTSVDTIQEQLDNAKKSRTGRLWVDCLIIPVMILHLYIRAVREGDWLLHLYALKRMQPYFFNAGHWNCARYTAWHLHDMTTSLPEDMWAAFLRGKHVCHHHSWVWNSVFLDQFGEQTYIRYGKSKDGLVGKTVF